MAGTEVHIYLRGNDGILERVSVMRWDAFEQGNQPLSRLGTRTEAAGDANRPNQIEVLLLTIRQGVCELAEPLCINVDDNGFVQKRELDMTALGTSAPALVDGRERFVNRYLRHAHQWRVDERTLAHACRMSGVGPDYVEVRQPA